MKIRTFRHIVKEGIVNSYRNKLMSLASIVIVIASLILFGIFLLVSYNLELNLKMWQQQPQLVAFCYTELDDTQVRLVEEAIKSISHVAECEKVTKEQAYQKMAEKLGKDSVVLEGYGKEIFPVSFVIRLNDADYCDEVLKDLEKISGIERVSYSKDTIEVISKVSHWIRIGCSFMIAVFLTASVFIIANTIKLTVFARRKEISIMKYIGATDSFIRWPFVVEGVIISIIGAAIAFVISAYGYNSIEAKFSQDTFWAGTELLKIAKIKDVWSQLALSYFLIAVLVGALGSILSIRKHLRV